MQAVKEKLNDMVTVRKVTADARAEEKAEKDLAKTRMEVAKEIRKAKEAEAAKELHVAKAEQRVDQEIAQHHANDPHLTREPELNHDHVLGGSNSNPGTGNRVTFDESENEPSHHHTHPILIGQSGPLGGTGHTKYH